MITKISKTKKADKINLAPFTGTFLNPEEVIGQLAIRQGDTVADLGCGNGFFTLPMARAVGEKGKVFAVDVMAVPLEAVKSRAHLNGLNNITVVRADLERANSLKEVIKDGECQHIFIANALCQAKKKKTVLGVARRILAPKGQLLIVEWKKAANKAFDGFGPAVELRFPEGKLKELVTQAGFKFLDLFAAGEFHFGMRFRKK